MNEPADKWIDAHPGSPVADVARESLQGRLSAVLYYLPRAAKRSGVDPDDVHDLRVWTRRSTAALRLYQDLLPCRRLCWIKKQLRRIRHAANGARDLDVLIQRLETEKHPSQAELSWLRQCRAERLEAQKDLIRVHHRLERDGRFARRIDKLVARVHTSDTRIAPRFGEWARHAVLPIVEQFFATVPQIRTDETALHQFRVRGKELRYAIELVAGAFPPALRDELYPTIEDIQDRLGDINDMATAREALRTEARGASGARIRADWHRLFRGEDTRLRRARAEFWEAYTSHSLEQLHHRFSDTTRHPRESARHPRAGGDPEK